MPLQMENRTKIFFPLVLIIVQVLVGCATQKTVTAVPQSSYVDRYSEDKIQAMTAIEAQRFISQTLYGRHLQLNDDRINIVIEVTSVKILDNTNIVFSGDLGWSISFPLTDIEYIDIIGDRNNTDNTSIKFRNQTVGIFTDIIAEKFVNALFTLKKVALYEPVRREESGFEEAVQRYHNAKAKPILPEEVRKLSVQAESAIKDKSFTEAADIYKKALNICPWWSVGHYNRAIVLSEVGDIKTAIFEMKRYLRLSPDAPDARAAQNKVYEWERKVGK